jgi:uncharacterized membrane protein YfcA
MLPSLFEMSSGQWILSLSAAFLIGVSKAGIKGIATIIVSMMALAFGSKESTGIMLPMLIVGDIYAVIIYKRYAELKYLKRLLPWMMIGVILGAYFGDYIPAKEFKTVMGIIILVSVLMMIVVDKRLKDKTPNHWAFAGSMGLAAGFTTMLGNLAGAFSNLFFLAMRLPKNSFIATAAVLFLCINIFKVPFHVFSWETINLKSIYINLAMLPVMFIGLYVGTLIVHKIDNAHYRKFIIVVTAIAGLAILFK